MCRDVIPQCLMGTRRPPLPFSTLTPPHGVSLERIQGETDRSIGSTVGRFSCPCSPSRLTRGLLPEVFPLRLSPGMLPLPSADSVSFDTTRHPVGTWTSLAVVHPSLLRWDRPPPLPLKPTIIFGLFSCSRAAPVSWAYIDCRLVQVEEARDTD